MAAKLQNLVIRGIALVDRGANQHAKVLLHKRAPEDAMPDEKLAKELADAKAALAKSEAELTELKGAGALSSDLDTMRKTYDRQKAELEKARGELQEQLEKAQKDHEATKAEVLKIRAQRRREQFVKRVGELKDLPGAPADDFAEILDAIDAGLHQAVPEKADKWFAKLNQLLTSWNVVVGKSKIFEEIGRETVGAFTGAEGQLHALAKEREEQARTSKQPISYAQAYAEILNEHPALYKQYRKEREGK
jgi:chromosome segregation ATPase